jgi:hypothetical protein
MSLQVCRNVSIAALAQERRMSVEEFRWRYKIGPGENVQECRPLNPPASSYVKVPVKTPPTQQKTPPPRPQRYIYDEKRYDKKSPRKAQAKRERTDVSPQQHKAKPPKARAKNRVPVRREGVQAR